MEKKSGVRAFYPMLSEEKLRDAEDNLERYLIVVLRIYERILSDPESYAQFRKLTEDTGTVSSGPGRLGHH